MAGFNPKDKLIKLQGKDYLEVRWRVFWFREQHPGGAITTELIATEPNVIVRAQMTRTTTSQTARSPHRRPRRSTAGRAIRPIASLPRPATTA